MIRIRSALLPALLFLGATALYFPLTARYFVSEDFLILRRLMEQPLGETLFAQSTGPWLETTVVLFYRPVASLLLLLQVALFGPNPHLLTLVQVLVHGVCVLLVFAIGRRLLAGEGDSGTAAAGIVAALFAVYPFHPNTVVWIASGVNLYAAAFLLLAVWFYLGERRWLALLAFALALGCYEAAAVLPLLLVVCDLCREGNGRGDPEEGRGGAGVWSRRVTRWGPYFLILGGYLLLRGWALGAVVGGYPQTRSRLVDAPLEVLGAALASPARILLPLEPALPLGFALVGTALLLALFGVVLWRRRSARRAWLGLGWLLLVQAPFGFVAVVPGNGRFWYLAAFGMALTVVALARSLVTGERQRWVLLATGAAVAGVWLTALLPNLARYAEAGELSRRVQGEITRATAAAITGDIDGEGSVFITRYPRFVYTEAGTPAAQVFTWGLRDAVGPPFQDRAVDLYPLPPLGDGALTAVALGQPDATLLVWDPATESLHPFRLTPALATVTATIQRYEALAPAPGAVIDPTDPSVEILLPAGSPAPTTLFLAGAGNPHREAVAATPDAQGRLHIPLPTAFLEAQGQLYNGVVYWWLETRGPEDRLLAYTLARELRLSTH